jgi:RNA polymerase sigma-70 factor (ECF subfamily)
VDDLDATFTGHRELLFGVAYRMLGSAADAEDVLQEAHVRWRAADTAAVHSPRAFLVTIVSRLCLDQLKSARARREVYVGPWLPEPVVTDEKVDPSTISTAFLLLLERLAPAERAAFLLKEVFEYDYDEIARILEKSEDACRQLASRARRHIHEARPRPPADRAEHARLLAAFAAAIQTGDLHTLETLLAADVTMHSDGGGRANAALKVIHGRDKVARFVLGTRRFYGAVEVEPRLLNGLPALLVVEDGKLRCTLTVDVEGGEIHAVHSVLNPEKLTRVGSS